MVNSTITRCGAHFRFVWSYEPDSQASRAAAMPRRRFGASTTGSARPLSLAPYPLRRLGRRSCGPARRWATSAGTLTRSANESRASKRPGVRFPEAWIPKGCKKESLTEAD